jgi:hypothetical protein
LEGVWFSTSNLKLAIALRDANFPLWEGAECTRILNQGRETFTWHFQGTNDNGDKIQDFVKEWEKPTSLPRPDALTCFFLAREVMFDRTHVISESSKVPQHRLLPSGEVQLLVTPRLGREEKEALRAMAS